jgi:hypothetical protein
MKDKEKQIEEYFYKLGVMNGSLLYTTYKYDSFNELCNKLTHIKNKYGWDMGLCSFVVQAYKDNSYDFNNSCFFQEKFMVNYWNKTREEWLKNKIESEYRENNYER